MSWNYRLMVTRQRQPDGTLVERFAVHEVFYDGGGKPNGFTREPVYPQGSTWLEFQKDLDNWHKATLVPRGKVLDARDVKGYVEPEPAQKPERAG